MKKSNRIFILGIHSLVPYLIFLDAFAPISTDMYLPALPSMTEDLGTSNELVSLSISSFMLIFAFSMLIWGPVSDRYGRRPILLWGTIVYTFSSVAIALCDSIWPLLFWRCIEALGSGAICISSLAIVKDIMHGDKMERAISLMQAATIIAPLTAPLIGGWMLLWTSWRGIFWCLAICGAIAFCGVFCFAEIAQRQDAIYLSTSFASMGDILKKRKFLYPLLLFSAMSMPFMSYLAASSFIFQDDFGVSAQTYSLMFALNAICSICGPISHFYLLRRIPRSIVIWLHLSGMTVGGILLTFLGINGPWFFALLFAPICYCGSALRPPSTILIMEIIEGNNGVVASLISCGALLFGSFSMFIANLGFWPNQVMAVGGITILVSISALLVWVKIGHNYRGTNE